MEKKQQMFSRGMPAGISGFPGTVQKDMPGHRTKKNYRVFIVFRQKMRIVSPCSASLNKHEQCSKEAEEKH
jgi:hypothetical protein